MTRALRLLLQRHSVRVAAIWLGTALPFALLGALEYERIIEETEALALERGQALFRLIQTTREWNALHGGVYVPVSELGEPNPYLDHPRRDLEVTDGSMLTMVNPAYMTRQIAELAAGRNDLHYRITSLDPIRPGNAADPWEAETLRRFAGGDVTERLGYVDAFAFGNDSSSSNRPAHRYMAPLYVTEACLPCHAARGFSVGDVRGGISVTMPADNLLLQRDQRHQEMFGLLGVVYLLSAGLLHGVATRTRRHVALLEELAHEQEAIIAERTEALREVNERLREQAHHDALTGLANRLLLEDRLKAAIRHARRYERGFAFMLIDLDWFKEVNDRHGHGIGDELLIEVAHRLLSCVRESDTVARFGGDEFAAILEDTVEREEAEHVARRMVESLSRPFALSVGEVVISASVGVAFFPRDGVSTKQLYKHADDALYAAKASGRTALRFHGEDLQDGV